MPYKSLGLGADYTAAHLRSILDTVPGAIVVIDETSHILSSRSFR